MASDGTVERNTYFPAFQHPPLLGTTGFDPPLFPRGGGGGGRGWRVGSWDFRHLCVTVWLTGLFRPVAQGPTMARSRDEGGWEEVLKIGLYGLGREHLPPWGWAS